ncbi:restriction endonuclease subunit S, partial [Pelomicrobium sp.]|uniref:restriction endonuclease subunit S n=1 Tax=Pelomicrobium sp. TaxID=2815319 RepID=UPI002FDCC3B6
MAGEWPKVSVSEVATAVIGGTPSRSVAEYWHGGIPWASAKDVARVSGRYLDQAQEFLTQDGLRNSAAKLMPVGTVVITARGTVGALAQLGRPMAFNQTCYALVPKDGLDNNFLFYALRGTIAEMHGLTYGTVFETITTKTFEHWLIPLPPLPEQRAIAHILGTLDDKIELNRKMSETLEAMARALFKAWFVDFDPVRAKMDGRWRRGQSLPGLPAHLYDLFPDRLV